MTIRIGVVADTHSPEFMERLPDSLFERLRGVDMILHAGDVGGQETLDRLAEIAPVEAIRGDHDRALKQLPATREIEVGGLRIAIVHGNRSRLWEEPVTLIGTLSLGLFWPSTGIHRWLRRRFPQADVIVYGHTHVASIRHWGGALVFNPGAVYHVTSAEAARRLRTGPNWFEWTWLQVIRHRINSGRPSVGRLDISDTGISATILPL